MWQLHALLVGKLWGATPQTMSRFGESCKTQRIESVVSVDHWNLLSWFAGRSRCGSPTASNLSQSASKAHFHRCVGSDPPDRRRYDETSGCQRAGLTPLEHTSLHTFPGFQHTLASCGSSHRSYKSTFPWLAHLPLLSALFTS